MTDISRTLRDITLRQLRTFRTVAARGNISAAARELHLTQPAVSMQLRDLEEACGLPLYERLGRGIALTAAGRELASAAGSILETLRSTQETLDSLCGLRTGVLRLAVVSTAKYFAPAILSAFSRNHPGIAVQLLVGNREEVIERLAANDCDLAIMGTPPAEVTTRAVEFAPHPQVIIAAPGHVLAGKTALSLKQLAGDSFVVREQGSGTRSAMEKFFARHGFDYRTAMEASSNETIKQAVMAGMGLSFMSRHTIALELAAGRLVILDVQGLPVVRAWYVLHRDGKRLSPAAAAFFAYLRDNGARCIEESLAPTGC
jgi:DNA-binding transcriptional LysR family regulator